MGSLCWKAISMDKLALLIILISFGQDSLLSATTSHEKVESLVDHLDMKFSQMMKNQKDQQEEINKQKEQIKQLQEENKQQHEDQQEEINKQKEEIKQLQETLSKLGEQPNDVSSLTELVHSLTNKSSDHEKSINVLRSPPAVFYCGVRFHTYATSSVLTFDKLSYSNSNQPTGGLDPVTGIFTSPTPGTYSVTWSLFSSNNNYDHSVDIFLLKNGVSVGEESRHKSEYTPSHYSRYTGPSGTVYDQGGRTLIIDLLLGETLSMWCEDCSAHVYDVIFCVSLVY